MNQSGMKPLSCPLLICLLSCLPSPLHAEMEQTEATTWSTDSVGDRNFNLDEIVVTGLRTPKLLKDTPVQTRLITATEITRADATNIQDLLTQEMPGLEFSYAMNQQTHLNFNGQGGQSVLFLVDGERLAGETMDDVDFTRLDLSNVDHIEIVKGASSALYGSNAGGGVINIITKTATRPWSIKADMRFGKHLEQRYNLLVSAAGKRVRNVFSGSFYSIKNYDVHSDPNPITRVITTIYGNRIWNFSDRLTYTPINNLKLTGRLGYFFRQLNRNHDTPERYRDFSAGLKADWNITDRDFLNLTYSFDQYDKSEYFRLSGLDVRGYSNVQNSVRALYSHSLDCGDIITAGADFMRDYMYNSKLLNPHRHQLSCDAFLQYDWMVSDKWELVGAVRHDWFSDGRISRVTPKISARYSPRFDINIRAGYGMGFRAPSLKEKYYEFDMSGIWIVSGNPALKPERSHNFNLSADYTHGNYNITVSGYYNLIHNKISTGTPYYRPDDATQLYLDYVNLSHYSVLGGEVALRARWNNGLSARITYAYTDEHLAKDRDDNTINNQYIPARKHSLTAGCDYEHRFSKVYSLTASISGRALSGVINVEYRDYYDISKGTVEVNYPAYTLWKVSLSQSFGKYVTVNLGVDNIFNYRPKHYYLNCPLTDGTSLTAGLSLLFP